MAMHPNSLANLNRNGRAPGSRNRRATLPTLDDVVKPVHVRRAWRKLVKLIAAR